MMKGSVVEMVIRIRALSNEGCLSLNLSHLEIPQLTLERFCRVTTHTPLYQLFVISIIVLVVAPKNDT